MLSGIEQIFRDILIFVAVMSALFIALIVIVSKLPEDNPLKLVLSALSRRVGITLGAGVVAIPVEPIPGLDAVYDVAVPVLLLWHWYTFARDAYRIMSSPTCRPQIGGDGRLVEHDR